MSDVKSLMIRDEAEMRSLGARLMTSAQAGNVITLRGELGTGKTTLVRGALHSCGVVTGVRSPTYTLVEFYPLQDMALAHFDLYRLSDPEELEYLGYRDYLNQQTLCFIEWPERAAGYLHGIDLEIQLTYDEQGRWVELKAQTDDGQRVIDNLSPGNTAPGLIRGQALHCQRTDISPPYIPYILILNGLTAAENGGASLCHGNSE